MGRSDIDRVGAEVIILLYSRSIPINRYVGDILGMTRITIDSEEIKNMAGNLNRGLDVFVAKMLLATKGVQLQT